MPLKNAEDAFPYFLGAKKNLPIYGLNRGVGLDKDREIFKKGEIDPEVRKISERFNKDPLYSHSAGVAPEASEEVVRAAMLVRLNTMLLGRTGVREFSAGYLAV